ncbi:hypothetical protein [Nostoc sp.]|uniref:hypothetical protein n=1 Tax=Nostoc sp. TaxID=1180 RepID=UPI002FFCFC29
MSRSQCPTGNAVLEAPPPLLAAEPQLKCISSPEAGNEIYINTEFSIQLDILT